MRTALPSGTATVRDAPWRALAAGLVGSLVVPSWLELAGAGTPASLVGPLGYLLAAGLVASRWPYRRLGAANGVTLARVVAASWVAAVLPLAPAGAWSPALTVLVVAAGTTAAVLDGLDGHVARSRALVSGFGARFDVEADAAMAVVLCLAVVLLDVAGWWVLAIAGIRYVYVAAAWAVPWLRAPLRPSRTRKVIGTAQAVALLVALAASLLPGLPTGTAGAVLAVALGTLCWSFARDIAWQHRAGPPAP